MGVKEGEVYKESERKRVRDGERGTKKAGENDIDIQKEGGLYFQKHLLHCRFHHQVGLEWPIYTLLQGAS